MIYARLLLQEEKDLINSAELVTSKWDGTNSIKLDTKIHKKPKYIRTYKNTKFNVDLNSLYIVLSGTNNDIWAADLDTLVKHNINIKN